MDEDGHMKNGVGGEMMELKTIIEKVTEEITSRNS
jgi:hypothetical protein